MRDVVSAEISGFLNPRRVYSRQEVLARPSPVPAAGGVYGWWFRCLPPLVDARGCHRHEDLTLLYAGISPRQQPRNGRPASQQTLWQRLWTHYAGNVEGSTLRKTLGCLLADELGIQLRRVGSGTRKTFAAGEQVLSAWMADNAFVSWVIRERPWELEDDLIAAVDPPLNLEGNSRNRFHQVLTRARARCVAEANALPACPIPAGVAGRQSRSPALTRQTQRKTAGWGRIRPCRRAAIRPSPSSALAGRPSGGSGRS